MRDRLPSAYEPNAALAWLYHRFFDHIQVDEAWAKAVREADRHGTVVYVMRTVSFVDFFALDYLTRRLELPRIRVASDLGLWVLEPMGRGWLNALAGRTRTKDAADLRRTVAMGGSAAFFLKRPAGMLDPAARGKGKIEGDDFIRALFDAQRNSERPILLVPQVFVWTKRQDNAQQNAVDVMLGPREWPGRIRAVAQFLTNFRDVTFRAGDPVDLQAFLRTESTSTPPPTDDVLVRRLTYRLMKRIERERRAVLGPTRKPADRLREEVVRSPKLQKIIHDMAGGVEAKRQALVSRAFQMVREMEAAPDINVIVPLETSVHAVVSQIYSGLEVDEEGLGRLRAAMKDGSLILLPSHKSHLDYIFIIHVFLRHHLPLPVVAAGDNLAFFPVGQIFRRGGAFFIRRNFHGDRLYGAVVDAYMRRVIMDGWSLEFFLEGGRSRTGKLLSPKLGLLSLAVDAALGVTSRKIYFAPISIGYERIVEEESYVRELSGGEKPKENVRGLLGSAGLFTGKYGRLNLQVGELLTLEGMLAEIEQQRGPSPRPSSAPPPSNASPGGAGPSLASRLSPARRRAVVTHLGYRVMNEINRVTAVTPGSLVAMALLTHGKRGIRHDDLIATCRRLGRTLRSFGARFTPSLTSPHEEGSLRVASLREALDLFARAGHVTIHVPGSTAQPTSRSEASEEAYYIVPDTARPSLDLPKNIVVHFFVARALVAAAVRSLCAAGEGTAVPTDAVKERVQALSRLFKHEFLFRADASFAQIFRETVAGMVGDRELFEEEGSLRVAEGESALQISLYAEIVRGYLEGYRIAARGLGALVRGPLSQKDLTRRTIALGDRMFLAEEIKLREAVSRAVIENAFTAFVDLGYLTRAGDKVSLSPAHATADGLAAIESTIVGYLPRLETPPLCPPAPPGKTPPLCPPASPGKAGGT